MSSRSPLERPNNIPRLFYSRKYPGLSHDTEYQCPRDGASTKMKYRFSILVPVYNRPDLVRETIASVFAQTYTNYELIVIDDGSTDNTLEVLRTYGDRIKVLTQKNQGAEAAKHLATTVAQGEYYVVLDSDDLLYPHSLAVYDRVIREYNSPPVIIGALRYYYTGGPIPPSRPPSEGVVAYKFENFFARDIVFGSSCSELVFRRDAVHETVTFPPVATAFPVDTADMMLVLSTHSPWIVVREPATIAYRMHGTNTIGNLPYMVQGVKRLLQYERDGRYPGGRAYSSARRAYLGGVAWHWFNRSLRAGHVGLALGLLFSALPSILLGIARKLRRKFHRPSTPDQLAW